MLTAPAGIAAKTIDSDNPSPIALHVTLNRRKLVRTGVLFSRSLWNPLPFSLSGMLDTARKKGPDPHTWATQTGYSNQTEFHEKCGADSSSQPPPATKTIGNGNESRKSSALVYPRP